MHSMPSAWVSTLAQEEQAAKERELEALQAQQGEINKQQAAAGAAPVEAAATARQRAMLQEEVRGWEHLGVITGRWWVQRSVDALLHCGMKL